MANPRRWLVHPPENRQKLRKDLRAGIVGNIDTAIEVLAELTVGMGVGGGGWQFRCSVRWGGDDSVPR